MRDALFLRASCAIDANHALREERRLLMEHRDRIVAELRLTVFESAMLRTEIKACRDNEDN